MLRKGAAGTDLDIQRLFQPRVFYSAPAAPARKLATCKTSTN